MIDVVVPAVREGPVGRLLGVLDREWTDGLGRVLVVWDGAPPAPVLARGLSIPVTVLSGGRRGPAAARNMGWRAADAPWVAFLDDDVVPETGWAAALLSDVAGAPAKVGAVLGRVGVPLPTDRRPTDWERNVGRLADARFLTADLACRRTALDDVGGLDERFPRAYREDTDLELRLTAAGWAIARGTRGVAHPVLPASPFVSVRLQRGNADDVLLWALHGTAAGVSPRGKLRYAAITATGVAGVALLAGCHPRAAAIAWGAWTVATGRFAWQRIAPGPRTRQEVARMLVTSAAIPPAAVVHTVAGIVRHRRLVARRMTSGRHT